MVLFFIIEKIYLFKLIDRDLFFIVVIIRMYEYQMFESMLCIKSVHSKLRWHVAVDLYDNTSRHLFDPVVYRI